MASGLELEAFRARWEILKMMFNMKLLALPVPCVLALLLDTKGALIIFRIGFGAGYTVVIYLL